MAQVISKTKKSSPNQLTVYLWNRSRSEMLASTNLDMSNAIQICWSTIKEFLPEINKSDLIGSKYKITITLTDDTIELLN